jgi:hypothetical protein
VKIRNDIERVQSKVLETFKRNEDPTEDFEKYWKVSELTNSITDFNVRIHNNG